MVLPKTSGRKQFLLSALSTGVASASTSPKTASNCQQYTPDHKVQTSEFGITFLQLMTHLMLTSKLATRCCCISNRLHVPFADFVPVLLLVLLHHP